MQHHHLSRLPPPIPPPTTIHDLPPEIIGRIIAIAYPALLDKSSERRERYGFLKATSLVCREWTPFAQEALWLDVSLYDQAIGRFLEAGAGRHATHKLFVDSGRGSDDFVEAILRDVRGVRDLQLMSCTVSIDLLCRDDFKDLKTLALHRVFESASVASHSLPFHLTTLVLSFDNTPSSSSLIDALSRQSSITSLLVVAHMFDPTALFARLAPLAPGLNSLVIYLTDAPGAAADFLKGCTHLKHLETCHMPLNAVKHIPASLASWTLHFIDSDELSTLLDVLETGSIATAKLKELVFEHSSLRILPQWVELAKMCKEKKIKLIEVDGEGNSNTMV